MVKRFHFHLRVLTAEGSRQSIYCKRSARDGIYASDSILNYKNLESVFCRRLEVRAPTACSVSIVALEPCVFGVNSSLNHDPVSYRKPCLCYWAPSQVNVIASYLDDPEVFGCWGVNSFHLVFLFSLKIFSCFSSLGCERDSFLIVPFDNIVFNNSSVVQKLESSCLIYT